MEDKQCFCNPVPFSDGKRHTNPDPFVLRWCGRYYCYATDEDGVKVSCSEDLVHWEYLGYAIKESNHKAYWAPSVLYQNGLFYMYYSNIDRKETDVHKQWLKLAVAHNPEGSFVWKKTFFDKFSIDSHPVIWHGKMYMFYSANDWIGTNEKVSGTVIMLDEMISPEEFSGNPRPVLLPSLEQEIFARNRFGDGRDWYTLEGAATVVHGNECFLTYSANAYTNVDYFIGTAVAENKNNFMDMQWNKYPSKDVWLPLLHKNQKVEGTGHNTIVKAPNMIDDWIVYHGRMAEEKLIEGVEQREMRIDPLYFNGRQMWCDGPSQTEKKAPALAAISIHDATINVEKKLSNAPRFYHAEVWISAKRNHIGCCYELFLDKRDERHYVKLQIHSGKRTVQLVEYYDGVQNVLAQMALEKEFDYTVPHFWAVDKIVNKYRISLDEKHELVATARFFLENLQGEISIAPRFTELCLHSFVLTESMALQGKDLIYFTENYDMGALCAVDASGLSALNDKMILKRHILDTSYTEEIQLEAENMNGTLGFVCGDFHYTFIPHNSDRFSIYCISDEKKRMIYVDGMHIPELGVMPENYTVYAKKMKILNYIYTKK